MTTDSPGEPERKGANVTTAVLKALWLPRPLLAIAVAAVACSVETSFGVLDFSAGQLASFIFGVSGTIVALVLPAAELANHFVTKLADEDLRTVLQADVPIEQKRTTLRTLTKSTRAALDPGWRAITFALVSFLASALGLILPKIRIPLMAGSALYLDSVVVLVALGTLITAAILFYPTAHYSFSMGTIDGVLEVAEGLKVAAAEMRSDGCAVKHPQAPAGVVENPAPPTGPPGDQAPHAPAPPASLVPPAPEPPPSGDGEKV
jgi:hypothetical protein